MPNLTEEQIQLYQAFSRLMPGDQFVSSSGTVAVIEAIQRVIDSSLLKDKAQSVNYAGPLLKDKTNDLVKRLRSITDTSVLCKDCYKSFEAAEEAADRIEALELAFRKIENMGQTVVPDHWDFRCKARDIARAALGEKKDG